MKYYYLVLKKSNNNKIIGCFLDWFDCINIDENKSCFFRNWNKIKKP